MTQTLDSLFIGGQWVRSNRLFDDINPSDGSVWAQVADASLDQAREAIDTAHDAFLEWSELPHTERGKHLLNVAAEFERRTEDLAKAAQGEGGAWYGKGLYEAKHTPEIFRAAAAASYQSIGEILPSASKKISMAVRRPMGVVTVISPWNFPTLLAARCLSFPIAAGNCVVLKPSEETPYTGGLLFAEVFEAAGVPPGVLNVLTCSRDSVATLGDELIENPRIKGISFTGSTAVGRMIAAKAGANLKKACVELGGKDALIICDDADLERASHAASFGSFMHQGQICMSAEKILVHEKVFDAFMEKFVARTGKLKTGDPNKDKGNVIGPLINDKQAGNVARQLEDAVTKGAKIHIGGKVDGRYVEPTILTGITSDMLVYQNETFGPLAPVIPFRSDDEAIAIANDTEYGLSSGVMTKDENRGLAIASALETGMSHINCSPVNDEPNAPFGGAKASGQGRYGGRWSMEAFTETRWITIDRGGKPYPPVF